MVHGLRRRAGGIDKQHKGSRLARLFREGIVENKAKHATLARSHVVDAHGNLVGLAFTLPFQWYEALGGQLVLGGRGMIPSEWSRLRLGNRRVGCRIEVGDGVRGEVRSTGAGVLDDTEVSVACQEEPRTGGKPGPYTHSDFLWGWRLQEMLQPSSTLTQRTIYDYAPVSRESGWAGPCEELPRWRDEVGPKSLDTHTLL